MKLYDSDATEEYLLDGKYVVRPLVLDCHECKHWEEQRDSIKGWCDKLEHYVYPDFFCADGEPKEVTD